MLVDAATIFIACQFLTFGAVWIIESFALI
jgi:hypothetical protein